MSRPIDPSSVLDRVSGVDLLGADDNSVDHPRRSPLHDLHLAASATIVEFGGCLWVDRYRSGVSCEYRAVIERVGVIDVSLMTQLGFEGPRAVEYLQHLFTNDVVNLAPGRMRYGAIVDDDGRVVDDGIVYRLADDEFLLMLNLAESQLPDSLMAQWSEPEAGCRNVTDGRAILQVQGPEAAPLVEQALTVEPGWVPSFFGCRRLESEGVIVGRCGFTGTDSVELIGPAAVIGMIWSRLVDGGAEPFGISTIEYLRVEGGMICHGHEFTIGSHLPAELGLAPFVKSSVSHLVAGWSQLSQPVEPMLHWVLGPLNDIDVDHLPTNGQPVTIGEVVVGRLTSTIFSPAASRIVALAMLDPELLDWSSKGNDVAATVGSQDVTVRKYRDSPFV